jgi:carboxypeptidase Q
MAKGWRVVVACGLGVLAIGRVRAADDPGRERLLAALLGPTPLAEDLEALSDRVGGRPTGSDANRRAVDWAIGRLAEAGVASRRERFAVGDQWLERSARAEVRGDAVAFAPRVAAMPFSTSTPAAGTSAPLLDAGRGVDADFTRLGAKARGAFLLVDQDLLTDVDGLFREYNETAAIEQRARTAGAAGVAYVSSRASGLLYRHNVAVGAANRAPMVVVEREAALRAMRLLRHGTSLTLTLWIDAETSASASAENVVAEIPGTSHPDEVVLMGAHLDSWDLGGGTLDNGANAALLIDVARQIVGLGLKPSRTIRLVLWNGEELGMRGSFGYVQAHAAELDRHVVAGAVDIGCGRVTGFYTNGRADLAPVVDRLLASQAGLGPFTQVDAPVVGTDNFDFMLEGVPNLIANQAPALYGPSYHAANDQLEQCDIGTLRLNAAIIGGVVWSFAQDSTRLPRHTHADVQALMDRTDLADQMKTFGLWDGWAAGTRGRKP